MTDKKKIRRLIKVILCNLCIVGVLLVGAEFLYRWFILERIRFEDQLYFEFDNELGWTTKPGSYDSETGKVTITSDRFRKTDPPGFSAQSKIILAVGDSYTFGNYAADDETWPYYLAEMLTARVVNAGVSGYGFDQSVLRLARVIGKVSPDLVILSLIYDDIPRSELSRRVHSKPYFRIVEGDMKVFNQPVPPLVMTKEGQCWYDNIRIVRDFKDSITGNVNPHRYDVREHHQGMVVARHLCILAQELVEKEGARLLILIQPNLEEALEYQKKGTDEFEAIARSLGISVLNLYPLLEFDFPDVDNRFDLWVYDFGHHSARGNKWVAEKLAEYLADKPEIYKINPIGK